MAYLENHIKNLETIYKDYRSLKNKSKDDTTKFVNSAYNQINIINKLIAMEAAGSKIDDIIINNNPVEKDAKKEAELKEERIKAAQEEISKRVKILKEKNAEELRKEKEIVAELERKRSLEREQAKPVVEEEKPKDEKKEETPQVMENNLKAVESQTNNEFEAMDVDEFIKQANIEEADKYENYTPEQVVKEEIESWGISNRLAGVRNILRLGSAYKASNKTLNKKSTDEEFYKYMAKVNGITEDRVKKNIDNIVNKADFTKSKFIPIFGKLKKKITNQILLRELIEFFMDDE